MTGQPPYSQDKKEVDTFSPKILFLQIKDGLEYLRSKWLIILLSGIVLGIAGFLNAWLTKPKFTAEITFSIDEGKPSSGKSEFSDFSEQLGLGPVDGGSVFGNVKNIEELLKSRLLIEKTLRSIYNNGDSGITYADFFLDSLDYREEWISQSAFPNLVFNTPKKNTKELLFENGIVSRMYKKVSNEFLKIGEKAKGTSITSVVCTSEHELFSKYFLEKLISEVTQYYIDSKTKRSKINLDIIVKRNDSILNAYTKSVYGRSAFSDADINVVRQTASAPIEKRQTDVQILRAAYIELSKNIEAAKTSLMNVTPLIELIDTPILPLDQKRTSPQKMFFFYFLVGGFLSVSFLMIRRVIKNVMS